MKPSRASVESNVRQVFRLGMLMVLAAAMPIEAQDSKDRPPGPLELRIVQAEGRDLIALPSHAGVPDLLQPVWGGLAAYSFEAGSLRIHVVEFEGQTFKAATPLDGSRSWIAFDPDRRAFASLLPSIRIELEPRPHLDAIASELGATGVTVFDSLGFAIIDLPGDLHPAEAVARVRNLPGEPRAAVRLRGPRIEWR
ncbi:MAG: hypothetical protein OXI90_08390 [Gammaproteobacteria bacterium]|nr:hypothetical protein [Gammaproteobacteria bacterium]